MIKDSRNQHQSKIVALLLNDEATDKALDEATIKATDKATIKATDKATDKPTDKPTDTIIEQKNNRTIEQKNNRTNTSVPTEVGTSHKKKKRLFFEVLREDYPPAEQQYYILANAFFDLFWSHAKELNLPLKNLKEADADEWTKHIRLMIEKNEATEEQIIEVGKFLKTDEFWKTNVRSVPKLREKFENIYASSKKIKNGNEQKSTLQDPEFQAMVMAKFATSPNFQGVKND